MILVEKNSFFFNLLSLRIFLLFYLIGFKIFFDKSAIFIFSQLSLIPNSGSFSIYRDITAALSPEVNIALSRSYAVEGQCFIIAPCAIVSEQIIEQLCTDETKRNFLKAGGGYARIFGPDGSELTTPQAENEEGLLLATLDPAAITFAKSIADPVGHYLRPDVICLLFNPAANRPLSIKTASFIELIDTKQIVLPGSEEVQAN